MGRLGVPPAKLIEMKKNPFKTLLIADLELAKAASDDQEWHGFLAESQQVGVPQALSCHPDKRKTYLALLGGIQVSWWKPNYLWVDLPEALEAIAP